MPSRYSNHVIKFINDFWKRHFYSPSIRDIKQELDKLPISGGNVSTSHISAILNELGYTKSIQDKGLARQIIPEWVKKAINEANINEQS